MKTYDPKGIICIVGGQQITGYADGTFLTVRRNADAWSLQMGADGEGARSKSNDKSGQYEFVLQQTSQSNAYLSSLAIADELNNGGLVPCLVKDLNGNSLHGSEQVYIKKMPDAGYGKEADSRSWILETDNLQHFVGGN